MDHRNADTERAIVTVTNSRSTLIDAIGQRHTPALGTVRIVSLVPSLTELLFALGLAPQIVGRTRYCVHPVSEVGSVPIVGGTKKVRMSDLRALRPTHVIVDVDENPKAMADEIRSFAPNLIVTHPKAPEDNPDLYRLFGSIFRCESRARQLVEQFRIALESAVKTCEALPCRRVLYLIWKDPWMTVSEDTYISRTLRLVRWETVSTGSGGRFPTVEPQERALRDVDLVAFSTEPFAFDAGHMEEFSHRFQIPKEKFIVVDGEMTSWYGSRAIAGLEYLARLARILH